MMTSRTIPPLPEEVGMGDGEEGVVVLQLPVKDPTFDLAKAVCNHGLFMMAPNGWDPATASLRRPLRLSSSSASLSVRVSQPSPPPDHLLVSVYCTTFLSSQDQDAILSQVRRMLRMSDENDRMIREFHTIHAAAKERGFGRIFRSPTLFEDMVKCILLCNCRYPIKLESKESKIYKGSKTCYLYFDTSLGEGILLSKDIQDYLSSLNTEYPSFLKPSIVFTETTDRTSMIDGASRIHFCFKRPAKKASKSGLESRQASFSSSGYGERKIVEKLRSSNSVSSSDGFIKSSSKDKSSSNSIQDMAQPVPATFTHFGNKSMLSVIPDATADEKFVSDEGTLCWNLLFSRLSFDVKKGCEINNLIKARIQRTLSNMRAPSYIGEITCTGLDLDNLPPYVHRMRVFPMDLNEVWFMESVNLNCKKTIKTSLESNSTGEVNSDFLEGIEHHRNQLKSSSNSAVGMDNRNEVDKADGLRNSKSTNWTLGYMSRWKAILHSLADQVSKSLPSDQLWFGFTTMPELDWNLDSSVGDQKITSSHTALLFGNRVKAAIHDSLVLPNLWMWPRTLSMAKALCELQLELKCCTISRELYPKTPQLREFKRKRHNTMDVIAKSVDKCQENRSNLAQKAMSFFNHDNHSNKSQRMETSTVGETDSIYDFEGLPIINKLDASSPVRQLSSGILCLPNTQGNFPSPEELANVDVNYLASRCKLGYRSQWIVSLAQDIVEHKIQFSKLEEICNGSTLYSYDELDKELSGIHGFGPFTRANILMCMGFYHKIPSDSETIRHLKQFHSIKNCTVRTARKNLKAIYGKCAPFQFLAYWFEMWTCYEEIFGKMTQMPPSNYQIVTGINMKVSEIKK
ncbi:HhH-GPD superfamily base excision DNA repair protein [Musa troglodytarum]|uniref:HhH-GPD superfamily base excision DNA repair protein n=1 Tax=Musa troglodytarum TaxID=320322 RepID=A0A9E7IGU6_9LILI|nr:HhH-GPD superfamily base excision DNA repair protein [Musa troglodytarum]